MIPSWLWWIGGGLLLLVTIWVVVKLAFGRKWTEEHIAKEADRIIDCLNRADLDIQARGALIGKTDYESLISSLGHPELREDSRAYLCGALAATATRDDRVARLLGKALSSSNKLVRGNAVLILGEVGDEQAAARLRAAYQKEADWDVRAAITVAMARIAGEQWLAAEDQDGSA